MSVQSPRNSSIFIMIIIIMEKKWVQNIPKTIFFNFENTTTDAEAKVLLEKGLWVPGCISARMFYQEFCSARSRELTRRLLQASLTGVLIQPKYQSSHPENYLFSLSNKTLSGSKYPKHIILKIEATIAARQPAPLPAPVTNCGFVPVDVPNTSPQTNVYFYHKKKVFNVESIPKIYNLILKTKSLVTSAPVF